MIVRHADHEIQKCNCYKEAMLKQDIQGQIEHTYSTADDDTGRAQESLARHPSGAYGGDAAVETGAV